MSINSHRMFSIPIVALAMLATFQGVVWAAAGTHEDSKPQVESRHWSWTDKRQDWAKARLARMAERLEVKASQQRAWQDYSNAALTLAEPHGERPATPDAAALARFRADQAAVRARKLGRLAEATATLQETLTPEQRVTFNQIVGHPHHRMARFENEPRSYHQRPWMSDPGPHSSGSDAVQSRPS